MGYFVLGFLLLWLLSKLLLTKMVVRDACIRNPGPGHSKLNLNAQRFQFRNASLRHSAVANPFCVTFVRSRCNTYVARPMIDEKIGIHADKYGPTPTS